MSKIGLLLQRVRNQRNRGFGRTRAVEAIHSVSEQLSIHRLGIEEFHRHLVPRIMARGIDRATGTLSDEGLNPVSGDFGKAHWKSRFYSRAASRSGLVKEKGCFCRKKA